jgi:hypothetical protein
LTDNVPFASTLANVATVLFAKTHSLRPTEDQMLLCYAMVSIEGILQDHIFEMCLGTNDSAQDEVLQNLKKNCAIWQLTHTIVGTAKKLYFPLKSAEIDALYNTIPTK